MEVSPQSEQSQLSQTVGRKQEFKQVRLDFAGCGPKQFVAEKKFNFTEILFVLNFLGKEQKIQGWDSLTMMSLTSIYLRLF